MKNFLFLSLLAVVLSGCVTQTTYSSRMIGNNPDTTTAKKQGWFNFGKQCDECSMGLSK